MPPSTRHVIAAPNAGSAATSGSRRAFGRPVGNLEPRDLGATAPIESRSPVPTRSSAASEGGSDVVQGSDQANLLLAGEPVDVRPRWDFRRTRPLPLADPGRGVGQPADTTRRSAPAGPPPEIRASPVRRHDCPAVQLRCGSSARLPRARTPVHGGALAYPCCGWSSAGPVAGMGLNANCPGRPSELVGIGTERSPGRGECVRDPGCAYGPMVPRPQQLEDGAMTPQTVSPLRHRRLGVPGWSATITGRP